MVRPVRVLLVGDGELIHVRRLAAALSGLDSHVEVACFEGEPIKGVLLHRIGGLPPSADVRYPLGIPPLTTLIARRRPDVVHGIFTSSYGLMAALATSLVRLSGRQRVHLVQSPLGSDLLLSARRSTVRRTLARVALGRAELVTYNSSILEPEIRRLAPRVRRHRFVWGPERGLFGDRAARNLVAVCTRRHEPIMRVDVVAAAWRRARERAPELLAGWRLVITHDGSEHARIAALAASEPSIDLAGKLTYAELQNLLLSSRLYLSVPESDAASAALLDGLAAGLLPVVNALPGNLEWVGRSIGEVVSRDPSIDEVADAIVRGAGRKFLPDRSRQPVRDVVWEDEVARLLTAYRSLSDPRNPEFPSARAD